MNAATLRRSLIQGISGTGGIIVLNRLLLLAMAIVLARVLGPEAFGHYAFAVSFVTLLAIPIQSGLPTLVTREVARAELDQRWGLMRGLIRFATGLVAVLSLLAIVISATVLWWISSGEPGERSRALLWSLLLAPLFGFTAVRVAVLQGLRRVLLAQLSDSILRPAVMLLLLGMLIVAGVQPTATGAVQLQIASWTTALLVGSVLLWRLLPMGVLTQPPEMHAKAWMNALWPLSLLAAMRVADIELSIVMLGLLGTDAEVGLYRVAMQGAMLMMLVSTAVGLVIAPFLTRLYEENQIARLQTIMRYGTLTATSFALPAFLIFLFWGKELITLVFGAAYADAHRSLTILAFAQLINAATGLSALLLDMTGLTHKALAGSAVALVANALLGITLIPAFGLEGAAIAASLSLIMWKVNLLRIARRETGVSTALIIWKRRA